jgi:D-lactate dehydrogenase
LRPADPVLARDLESILAPERVLTRPIDRLGRSADASIYRLIPEAVVRPRDRKEIAALLAYCRRNRRHLTFRTAGTSLSGQSVSDDLLVELGPYWKATRVLEGGRRIWSQPAVVGAHLNKLLAPYGARIGPDPASIDAAMIGGIVSNNSSGMCCGVAQNSYHTLDALEFLLTDGTHVDTGRPGADERLRRDRPDIHLGLLALRDEIRSDAALSARIRHKFRTKNTTGYSLHAFLDHDRPADILAHLMVGAEGTLGFLAGITMKTVPEPPARATGLIFFEELREAGAAVAPLAEAGAAALEILDSASLRSVSRQHPYPFPITSGMAALLTEFREPDEGALAAAIETGRRVFARFATPGGVTFTTDAAERAHLWKLRKGLFATGGAMRPSGTVLMTEDVAVPVSRLAEAVTDCQRMFTEFDVPETMLFGHAKDGNLHFLLWEDLRHPAAVDRYGRFMQALVDLVVGKFDGAVKAEHGSGRNMAPFVRQEWGEKAYELMRRVKRLLDPDGILNPGVILNDDPRVHLKDLKEMPSISAVADRCIECGFCEPRCPSRELTLSPRQRIIVTREIRRLGESPAPEAQAARASLLADYGYEGIETCAGDSMCQTACPVDIDTGALVKEAKAAAHSEGARWVAGQVAARFAATTALARSGLRLAGALRALPGGAELLASLTRAAHAIAPSVVPRVPTALGLPTAASRLPLVANGGAPSGARVVYFPSCLNRVIGHEGGRVSTPQAVVDVLRWAGRTVAYPEGLAELCCGMPFASKAFNEAAQTAAARTAEALWTASRDGRDPVVTDASPCAGFLHEAAAFLARSGRTLRILDFTAYWAREVLAGRAQANVPRRAGTAVLHPTCTLVKTGGLPDLRRVAEAHCERVVVPANAECCGFAGDRGFFTPELTAKAAAAEGAEVRALLASEPAGLYSTCRTCEIGMSRAVGRPYLSVPHLVREAVMPDA